MEIRNAAKEDLEFIMRVEENSFIPNIQETWQTFSSRIDAFADGFFVLVDDKGVVQGYLSSEIWEELPHDNKVFILDHDIHKVHKKEGSVLYMSSFALMPALRGRKLGKPFLKRCMEIIMKAHPNIKNAVLIVSQEWESAIHIYETLGFKTIRRIPGFFASETIPGGADGIVMWK